MINETTNFSSNITVKDEINNDVIVASLYATLDKATMNLSLSISTSDQTLAKAKAIEVQAQYAEFETLVKTRAKELGYPMFA